MGNKVSREEKIGAVILFFATNVFIYFVLKSEGRKPFWPITWVMIFLEYLLYGILYIGLPAGVLYGAYWYINQSIEKKLARLWQMTKENMSYLRSEFCDSKNYLVKINNTNLDEIKNLKEELQALKTEVAAKNKPAQEVQEITLENFLN
jgi:hypothetical protein